MLNKYTHIHMLREQKKTLFQKHTSLSEKWDYLNGSSNMYFYPCVGPSMAKVSLLMENRLLAHLEKGSPHTWRSVKAS